MVEVTIEEGGNYPISQGIDFRIKPAKQVKFLIYRESRAGANKRRSRSTTNVLTQISRREGSHQPRMEDE